MIKRSNTIIYLGVLYAFTITTESFSPNGFEIRVARPIQHRASSKNVILSSVCDDEIEAPYEETAGTEIESNNDKELETLCFGGTYSYRSKKFSLPMVTVESLEEILNTFLDDKKIQNTLLSGGKNSTIEAVSEKDLTSAMISIWHDQANTLDVDKPNISSDSVVVVTPPGIELVTVTVVPTTTIATKIANKFIDNNIMLPEFQAILIKDEPRAIGPKFFVWLFNKIAHGGNPDDKTINKKESKRKESAILKVYIDSVEMNDDEISFFIVADSVLKLEFLFPKLLIRFFPMKKEKAEKLCGDAIVKALETNMIPAMDSFCEAFEKYTEKRK